MASEVQSLRFRRDCWTVAEASAWSKRHGFRSGPVEPYSSRWWSIRQIDPRPGRYATVQFGAEELGLRAVILMPTRAELEAAAAAAEVVQWLSSGED